jgi:hypothetical protein
MAAHRSVPSRTRLVAIAIAVAVAAAACSNAKADNGSGDGPTSTARIASGAQASGSNNSPGVTADEIRFAAFGTNANNPTGQCVLTCFDAGVKAYFAWRNSEGGLFGRRLVLSQELDDQVGQNHERALEIISADNVFGAFSSALVASGYADMAKAGIPLYTWALNFTEMNGHPSIYGDRAVLCAGCTSRFFPYSGSLVHAKKVAALGYGVAQNSRDCVASIDKSVKRFSARTGQSMAYTNDQLDFGLPNGLAPQVTAMKDAGVNFVATCLDLNGVKTLEQEMERQGMGDVPVLHNDSYDAGFIKDGGALFEGDIVQTSFRPFEANAAGSQLDRFKEWMGKTGEPLSEPALQGWINADLAYEGIKAAGPSFTRSSVIDATNRMTAFTGGGLIPPIDWSRQHEMWTDADPLTHGYATECRAFVRVTHGRFQLVGDKDKPFVCYDPKSQAWTSPTPTNFK